MANKKKGKKKEKRKIVRKTNITLKKKKKSWVSIVAPKEFGNIDLGDSYVSDSQNLKGKRLKVSLSNLGKAKNPSIKIIFQVKEIADGKAITEAIGYYVLNSFSRRVVNKGRTKMGKTFNLKTKDGSNVIMKVVMSSQNKIPSRISKAIRVKLDEAVSSELKKSDFDRVLDSVIKYIFQKSLKSEVSKVYPVPSLEITSFRKVF
jgi:small subunit ribosomal protein S3Ae